MVKSASDKEPPTSSFGLELFISTICVLTSYVLVHWWGRSGYQQLVITNSNDSLIKGCYFFSSVIFTKDLTFKETVKEVNLSTDHLNQLLLQHTFTNITVKQEKKQSQNTALYSIIVLFNMSNYQLFNKQL